MSQNNTVHVEINAHGCALIHDWKKVYEWGMETKSVITRIDLAHDDFEGKTVNINICRDWYDKGLFKANGRPPKPFLYDDCGTLDGKTFEVGNRKNGGNVRMYEKGGKQGDPHSPWFRVELELRNKNREIPWEIILKHSQYLAGSYKAFNYLSVEQSKVKTIKKQKEMTYKQTVEWLRTTAGKAINVMIQENDGDIAAVFEQIVRNGVPKRLEPYYGKGTK